MAARTTFGILVSLIGLALFLWAAFNFNSLFFTKQAIGRADIPTYDSLVVLPTLLGILLLADGSFILGLKRVFSLSLHLLGNIVWLFASVTLYANLLIPIVQVGEYQSVFILFLLALIVFIVGIIVNDIPKKQGS